MEKSIRSGDWVRSIEKSYYPSNEEQCPVGEIRQSFWVINDIIYFREDAMDGWSS